MYFYGISLKEIYEKENEFIEILWQSMTMIEAQEQLKSFEVIDWPRMKKNEREKRHKDLFSKAYPGEMKPKNYISVDDISRVLGR